MTRLFALAVLSVWALLIAIVAPGAYAAEQQDIIARVGDQTITLHEIDTMINSSTIVGIEIPAPGTPERNAARFSLLDKVISADLLYLDALQMGLDKDPDYQHKVKSFGENILAALYKEKVMTGELRVTEAEVKDYYKKNIASGTELTADVKLSIEAKIRKEKFKARNEGMRQKIRQGATVAVVSKELEPAGDSARKASAVVARVNNEEIHWGEVKPYMPPSTGKEPLLQRMKSLDSLIDERIMAAKAREMGIEKEPLYQARMDEFKKTSLINMHQGNLYKKFSPQDSEVKSYYEKNRNKIIQPEVRKVQMMVLKTRKEADEIKEKIKSNKMTFFEAAQNYSIDPNAKQNLGEIGWVSKGTGFPELDKLTFSLKKDQLGGPVETPVGWHLVKIQDKRDARYQNIKDKATFDETRQILMHEKMDQYTAALRKEKFPVTVYDEVFKQQIEKEAATMQKKASGEMSKQEVK